MRIQCPHCHREFRVADNVSGKVARCQSCSQVFRIPVQQARPVIQPAIPVTPPVQPSGPVNPTVDSLENPLAEHTGVAPLPASLPPPPSDTALPQIRSSPHVTRRSRPPTELRAPGLVLLVPTAQFLVGLPLAYAAGSFAWTATYESAEACTAMLLCTAFGVLVFLAGVFNFTWFFHYGKFGRITRSLGPRVTRMLCLGIGTFLIVGTIVGTSNNLTLSERMWPLAGPTIREKEEDTLPDYLPKPKSGSDRLRAPGVRIPRGH